MAKILIQKSHYSPTRANGWSGAPGEADWVVALCGKLDSAFHNAGVTTVWTNGDLGIVVNDNDTLIALRHPEFSVDYDAFISLHYDANVYGIGGWFWDRAETSLTAVADDRLGSIWENRFKALPGVPGFHPERRNANTRNYYAFRQTTNKTPGIIVEHGVGAPGAPDYQWLRDNLDAIAQCWVSTILEFLGNAIIVPPVTNLAGADIHRAIIGDSTLAFRNVATKLAIQNPDAPLTIVSLYENLCPKAGIRAEVALAQALKETNFFRFTGTADRKWYNPAGLGVTGSPGVGNQFDTWESGIRAHIGHLLWYFGEHIPEFCDLDKRHFGDHKHLPNDVSQLDGHWAIPGAGYGQSLLDLIDHANKSPI